MVYTTHNSTREQEKHSLRTEDHTAATSVQSGLIKPHTLLAIKPPVSIQQDRPIPERTLQFGSAAHLIYLRNLYRAYITMHLRYLGHRRKHNTDEPASTPITSVSFLITFFHYPLPQVTQRLVIPCTLLEFGSVHSPRGYFRQGILPLRQHNADVR